MRLQILGSNYLPALEKWIAIENIPQFLGGKSQGTLVDDAGPWSDPELVASLGLNMTDLRHGRPPSATSHMPTPPSFGQLQPSTSAEGCAGFMTPAPSISVNAHVAGCVWKGRHACGLVHHAYMENDISPSI